MLNSIISLNTLTLYKGIICLFYSVPIVISVHCIIASMYRCNLTDTYFVHLFLKFLYKALSGCRCCITTIKESMNIYIFKTISLCKF